VLENYKTQLENVTADRERLQTMLTAWWQMIGKETRRTDG
jgi:hypothetical protein